MADTYGITRIAEPSFNAAYNLKKIILLIGPRQIGKTTFLRQLAGKEQHVLSLNCDDSDDVFMLEEKSSSELRKLLFGYDYVFIDEAQRIKNVGLVLKKIGDLHLDSKIFVTGSSSFDLAGSSNEPATGRIMQYKFYPLSTQEMIFHTDEREERRMLENRLIYGMYPEVVTHLGYAREILSNITENYLYKDILAFGGIKKSDLLQKLVRALAFQVGSEVSYNELANMLGVDKETVENYINLLEKVFVVFRLDSYSRNLRNEIKKGKKIYFYDNGIRNAAINNFSPLETRNDVGILWENFIIMERQKRKALLNDYSHSFFWRTHSQQEIDYLEEGDGKLSAYEFKYNPKAKSKIPPAFAKAYPDAHYEVVNKENYLDFVLGMAGGEGDIHLSSNSSTSF